MVKLKKKIFLTIFTIITSFIITTTIIFNVQSYKKEYDGIKSNLTRMNLVLFNPEKLPMNNDLLINDLNNKMIMDYNFYTFVLDRNNTVIYQISHSENSLSTQSIQKIIKILSLNHSNEIYISSLYFDNISYYLQSGSYLIVVDTAIVQQRLFNGLLISLLLLLIFEMIVYYLSIKITNWITNPVEDAFNKQKTFITDASHELKTPLSVIMASVGCIDVNKDNEKWISHIKMEADKMSHLISKLLDLSKSENKTDKEFYAINNLSKIVEKRALIFESLAYEHSLTINTNIERDIEFNCNHIEIDEVVTIIIDNAIKHSFKNSSINVNLYKDKNDIILDIINNGEDIPSDETDKIFERFYRTDKSRNRESNRYGLGLAIARNIVHNHGGSIKAFSSNNVTTFRIIFRIEKH